MIWQSIGLYKNFFKAHIWVRNNKPFFTNTIFVLVTQFRRVPVSMQSDAHMSNEQAVIAGKFRRARYVISIKARSHNYAARGKLVSKYRSEYFPILCAVGEKITKEVKKKTEQR